MNDLQKQLFAIQDQKNKGFTAKLIPNIDKETIIGIRIPILRKLAKDFFKYRQNESIIFLTQLPHKYYEENLLHSFLIEQMKDFEQVIDYTEKFLPFIDNWAVCDTFSPKIFRKYPKQTYEYILKWINTSHSYTVRYAVGLLLSNYLDDFFEPEMLDLVAGVTCEEYYVNMMLAWYFATALVKQKEATLPIIQSKKLDTFVQNKTIQKARESYRISQEIKDFLQTLKKT